MIGNEKWILCKNMEWKGMWGKWNEPPPTTRKANLHPKKVTLRVLWNWKGVLYYEFFLKNQQVLLPIRPIESNIWQKCPESVNRKCITFHQDNSRLHVSLMTRQNCYFFGWEVLIHPLYSPDITPSNFHLLQSLQNYLNGKNKIKSIP